jgi:hypothetical protein
MKAVNRSSPHMSRGRVRSTVTFDGIVGVRNGDQRPGETIGSFLALIVDL